MYFQVQCHTVLRFIWFNKHLQWFWQIVYSILKRKIAWMMVWLLISTLLWENCVVGNAIAKKRESIVVLSIWERPLRHAVKESQILNAIWQLLNSKDTNTSKIWTRCQIVHYCRSSTREASTRRSWSVPVTAAAFKPRSAETSARLRLALRHNFQCGSNSQVVRPWYVTSYSLRRIHNDAITSVLYSDRGVEPRTMWLNVASLQ